MRGLNRPLVGKIVMGLDKKCYECRSAKDDDGEFFCSECRSMGIVMNQFPGTSGLSDGPTSGVHESVFSRPDPLNETRRMAKKMEEAGTLNKETTKILSDKISAMERQEPTRKKVDYQKAGHPMA